jgi:negative regulator of sigma-B (phosphoserine phosphatase)
MNFEVAHLSLPKPGERENGDAVLVRRDADERLLLAVVDGLGHGASAAEASRAAVERLGAVAWDLPLLEVMQALDHGLSRTIGVAATVCLVRGGSLEVCAVGNVRFVSVGSLVPLVPSAGVLGRRVARYHVCRGQLRPGSRFGLFSDGISRRAQLEDAGALAPAHACKEFIARFRTREDDATILIARAD